MAKKRADKGQGDSAKGIAGDSDEQLLELYRTLRDDPATAAKIVATMPPADAERIRELWRTVRKAKGIDGNTIHRAHGRRR